jgi:hypothetical protein
MERVRWTLSARPAFPGEEEVRCKGPLDPFGPARIPEQQNLLSVAYR